MLAKSLTPYLRTHPEHSHIHPLTFDYPAEKQALKAYRQVHPDEAIIFKPGFSSRGRGIRLLAHDE